MPDGPPETIPISGIEEEADAIADLYGEGDESEAPDAEDGSVEPVSGVNEVVRAEAQTALLSLETARSKIDPATLSALKERFNGSITTVRHLEDRDTLF